MEISTSYGEDENDDYDKKKEKERKKKNALSIWKTGALMKLMGFLENKDNRTIVTHAIKFILHLEMEEKVRGINASLLKKSEQKEFRAVFHTELSENLPN